MTTGKGYRPRPLDLVRGRWIAGGIIIANFLVVLVLPLITLLWMSLLPFLRSFSVEGLTALTLKNYRYFELALNSLSVAAAAATAIMLITELAGWIAARNRPGGRWLDQLATLSLVFPGICLGMAVMRASPAPDRSPLFAASWCHC